MKPFSHTLAWVILLSMLFSMLSVFTVGAGGTAPQSDDESSSYKQKVIAVVYDNSYSMVNNMVTGHSENGIRATSAKYALQMLISLLDEKDQMFIVPMNNGNYSAADYKADGSAPEKIGSVTGKNLVATEKDIVDVTLTSNRQNDLNKVWSNTVLRIPGTSAANTPSDAVGIAIDRMESKHSLPENGSDVESSDLEKEYWLIVLTDGMFNNCETGKAQQNEVKKYIGNYTDYLNTVLASFGGDNEMPADSTSKLSSFYTPKNSSPEVLAETVQKISNLILGRYTLDSTASSAFSVSGSTVTVNLDKFKFSLSSVSVIAQNCGASIKSVKYNGAEVRSLQSANLKTKFDFETHWKSKTDSINLSPGCSCKAVPNNKYFSEGKLVFEFEGTVNKDMLSIFVEPAIDLDFDVLDKNNSISTSLIFEDGDKVRVKYKVVDPASSNKEEISLSDVFPGTKTTASLNYNGKEYSIGADNTSEPITLSQGKGILTLTVKANDGKYTLRHSRPVSVSAKGLSIEASGDKTFDTVKDVSVSFKIFALINGQKTQVKNLGDYVINKDSIKATTDNGQTVAVPYPFDVKDGAVTATLKTSSLAKPAEKLTITFKATTPEGAPVSGSYTMTYDEPPYSINVSGDTTFPDKKTEATVKFTVMVAGNPTSASTLKNYKIDVVASNPDHKPEFSKSTDSEGNIVVTVKVDPKEFGDYTVTCVATFPDSLGGKQMEKSQTLTYKPETLEINTEQGAPESISLIQHQFKDNDKGFTFLLTANGSIPYPFDTTISQYTLTVGKTQITDVKVDGNKLTFIPTADNLKEIIKNPGDKEVTLSISNSTPELSPSKTVKLEVIQTKFVITPEGSTSLEFTTNSIKNNKPGSDKLKSFTFLLTANGEDYPFGTDISKFRLTVGGKEITDVTVDGNKLTFTPTFENVKDLVLAPSEDPREVKLVIVDGDCTPGVTQLIIKKARIEIDVHPSSIKEIDRFDLKNTDAVLYFTIKRDGEYLPASELETNLDQIVIEKASMFKNFILPSALSPAYVTKTEDGTAVVAVKVTCDMARYFEWHYSAFIKGGDKAVTLKYSGEECLDFFTVTPSKTSQHVIRIGLLVLAHIILFYLITYVVGFFIVKPLPTGVFIVVKPSGSSSFTRVNTTFWKKYGWHLTRFAVPWKVLSSQSIKGQCPTCSGLTFRNEKGRIKAKVERANVICPATISDGLPSNLMEEYTKRTLSEKDLSFNLKTLIKKKAPHLTGGSFFMASGDYLPQSSNIDLNALNWYRCRKPPQAGGDFAYAVTFTKLNMKKRRKR